MRIKTPELSFESRILNKTLIVQLPSLPPVQYNNPIPPCPLIRPFSTSIDPGPTCFQPLRSLPSNNCIHPEVSGAGKAGRTDEAVTRAISLECQPARMKRPAAANVANQVF